MSINYPVKQDMEKLLGSVQAEYDRQVSVADYFRKKCEEFRKDDEIKKLEHEIKEVRRHSIQVVSDIELDEINKFRNQHHRSCKKYEFGYFISGTGFGTAIEIQCLACGEKKDITDYSNW